MTEHNPRTWLSTWTPEDPAFWESKGKSLAWKTLTITTLNLMMAFIVWFMVSALVVRLLRDVIRVLIPDPSPGSTCPRRRG